MSSKIIDQYQIKKACKIKKQFEAFWNKSEIVSLKLINSNFNEFPVIYSHFLSRFKSFVSKLLEAWTR